jgi:ribosomal protein L11 methyltransferase
METKYFREYTIETEPFLPEVVSGLLWELETNGIVEEPNYLRVYANDDDSVTKDSLEAVLQKLVNQNVINSFTVTQHTFQDKNWNEEWEKQINVIEVSDRIVIKPTFREYTPKAGQIIITIDPKMSFGTGEHSTTRIVLRLLEKYVKKGARVIDVGTGTGVLAIASVLLGAEFALGIDNDEWCYENALENIERNLEVNKAEFRLAEIGQVDEKNFNLVLANIQKNVLLDIAEELVNRLLPGGTLILSGLLIEDEKDITDKYTSLGLKFIEKTNLDEWIGLVFEK